MRHESREQDSVLVVEPEASLMAGLRHFDYEAVDDAIARARQLQPVN